MNVGRRGRRCDRKLDSLLRILLGELRVFVLLLDEVARLLLLLNLLLNLLREGFRSGSVSM